ncbi:hypothetical protein [Kitasatospora brasiliensis]|uniref:hypothetical protein n=1 Tax=Kitasatospora brasiliensis TaxID=3058040 RepID=UPI00292FAE48|nr:hypothetical protein [Kitasatospora sp. K002]
MLRVPESAWPQRQNATWATLREAVRTALSAVSAAQAQPGPERLDLMRDALSGARATGLAAHMAVYQQQAATARSADPVHGRTGRPNRSGFEKRPPRGHA